KDPDSDSLRVTDLTTAPEKKLEPMPDFQERSVNRGAPTDSVSEGARRSDITECPASTDPAIDDPYLTDTDQVTDLGDAPLSSVRARSRQVAAVGTGTPGYDLLEKLGEGGM